MRSGKTAVFAVFALPGVLVGSWVPRVPAIAEHVDADVGTLGLALLGGSIGLIIAAPLAGRFCARFGARLAVVIAALVAAAILPLLALAPTVPLLGVVLILLGASSGMLDVGMNIAAVTVVRQTGRPLMPVFHAGFSVGGLLGAGGAALAATYRVPTIEHFTVVAVLAMLMLAAVVRQVPNEPVLGVRDSDNRERTGRSPARRPVLWLLGAVVLCSALAEGASADWSALFAVRERGLTEAAAAIVYAVFSIAMAITRLLGERAERRWGPERLLIGGAIASGSGLFIAVLIPAGWASFVGFTLTGAGLAYAFPVALGLAGAAGRRANGSGGERELAFVTAIAYGGFLLGPPMVGGIAHLTNLAVALGVAGVIATMMALAGLGARWARRREELDPAVLAGQRTESVSRA